MTARKKAAVTRVEAGGAVGMVHGDVEPDERSREAMRGIVAAAAKMIGGAESTSTDDYARFIERKSQLDSDGGFAPVWMPEFLFDFQKALVEWSLRKGRAAIFANTGMGKTAMELVWADNVARHTNRPVLILTPLSVAAQTVREADKFGVQCSRIDGRVASAGVYVTNYERLHHLDPDDFAGLVCDEASLLKSADGQTRKAVTRFALKLQYRLLATATPAPNDYIELGTASEVLGNLGNSDMLSRYFKQSDAKGSRIEDVKASRKDREIEVFGNALRGPGNHFQKLSYRVSRDMGKWTMKAHAVEPFWKWVASWARACRKPSDLGPFDDTPFNLPPLIERTHEVAAEKPPEGQLFTLPAFGLREERDERRRTLKERCELVARLVDHDRPAVVWCQMNAEGDLLEKIIPNAVQVSGANSDDEKEERYEAFRLGQKRVMVIKPKVGALGLNWQFCSDVVTFASHSYQDHYQLIRRCWRFGQTRPVTVDIISTEGEVRVRDSMARKSAQADAMFAEIVKHMQGAMHVEAAARDTVEMEVPSWL